MLQVRAHLYISRASPTFCFSTGLTERASRVGLEELKPASTSNVSARSGSGKTALLAYISQQPFLTGTETGDVKPLILRRFIGSHPASSILRGLMTSLCRELREQFPISESLPDDLQKLLDEFYTQLRQATAAQPIYVFLDALDQLEASDQARDLFWLCCVIPSPPNEASCHARIVASCLSPSPEFPLESEACEPFRKL